MLRYYKKKKRTKKKQRSKRERTTASCTLLLLFKAIGNKGEKIEDKNATNVQPSSKHIAAHCGDKVHDHVLQGNFTVG